MERSTLRVGLRYSTVAFAALYGFLLWGDTLSSSSMLGLSPIVLSGMLLLGGPTKPIQVES